MVKFTKFQIGAMIATVVFVIAFVVPVETIIEDRGGGREVEIKKTLFQVLFEPRVDIEIPVDKEPTFCIEIFAPVCGNDGVTYSNSCFAEGAGVEIVHDGQCTGEQDPNDGFQDEMMQGIVDAMEAPSEFCRIYPDFVVCQ